MARDVKVRMRRRLITLGAARTGDGYGWHIRPADRESGSATNWTRPRTFTLRFRLVPFPLEYALYRIFVSPVSHSRASRNPELEAAFQYQQIYLETVLVL